MNLIKNETISEKELEMLREQFKIDYSLRKGWDPKNLKTEQMIEITQQKAWKTPGLLLS